MPIGYAESIEIVSPASFMEAVVRYTKPANHIRRMGTALLSIPAGNGYVKIRDLTISGGLISGFAICYISVMIPIV